MPDPVDQILLPSIRFEPNQTPSLRFYVHLEGELTLRYGLKPDTFTVTCHADDFLALGYGDRVGKLLFQGDVNDPKPVVEVCDVEIVDVRFDQNGVPHPGNDSQGFDPKNEPVVPITLKLILSDFRCRLVPPRGGILEYGEFNKAPLDFNKKLDALDRVIRTNMDVLAICAKFMGFKQVDTLDNLKRRCIHIPFSVNDREQISNLSWRGGSAVEEFERLLKVLGHIVVPTLSGGLRVIREATDPDPEFTDYESVLPTGSIDRRARRIVISSAPSAIREIQDLPGIQPDGFEYVWRDVVSGRYKRQEEIPYLKDFDLLDQFKKFWKDIPKAVVNGQQVDLKQLLEATAFKRIRLNAEKYPGVRMFALNPDPKKGYIVPQIMARVWRYDSSLDVALQSAEPQAIKITAIHQEGTVICTDWALLKLDVERTPYSNRYNRMVLLGKNDLTARLSWEAWQGDDKGPEFFRIGFEGYFEAFKTIKPAELTDEFDPEIVISRPELIETRINGASQNGYDLEKRALAIALAYLPAKPNVGKRYSFSGFKKQDLDSRVCMVSFSQIPPKTTVEINTFATLQNGRSWVPESADPSIDKERRQLVTPEYSVNVVQIDPGGGGGGGGGDGLFVVQLATDGGSNGGIASPPTYTYAILDDAGKITAAQKTPEWIRPNGQFLPATMGIARFVDGAISLVVANEVEQTGDCDNG